jgi:hypothetical protein
MARSQLKTPGATSASYLQYKDAVLDHLAEVANVAQFVSFAPGSEPQLRFARLSGIDSQQHRSIDDTVAALMARSVERSVNVRSFHPNSPKANEFIYGLTELGAVTDAVRRLAGQGLYTIVNETIDVRDGGVSGVSYGGILEFAPGDTPRAVEKPGIVSLSRGMGLQILETVYGFQADLPYPPHVRVEFSIHPLRRGVRHAHTIIWELESTAQIKLRANPVWPNLFSRHVGDKTFGLLIADAISLPVPETIVVGRRVAPFRFGRPTGTGERWIRTSPAEQTPGKFTTRRGWIDPYVLISMEDPQGSLIASVLDQEGVDARYSGAAIADPDGKLTIEGVSGYGDAFMQGLVAPQKLPPAVTRKVTTTFNTAAARLGPVRFEWAADDHRVWILQLHRGVTPTIGGTIFPGNPTAEHRFAVERGLDALRALIGELPPGQNHGVVLVGQVGVTSHFGDVLRRARIPSRVEGNGSTERVGDST